MIFIIKPHNYNSTIVTAIFQAGCVSPSGDCLYHFPCFQAGCVSPSGDCL